ncbi:Thiol-disulfide oxidoreductase ResA [subsurface metagenome]
MPKYNPKEARDVKARKQKRIAASKKKRHFRQFMPYILIIGVIIIVGSMAIYFYLSDYNNGEDGGENGGNGDNNEYGTPMTFTTIDGDTIKLADNQGKVIILYFFDLDCPPCGPQAEILAEIDKDYSNSQLLIIPITVHYYDSTNDLIIWKQNYNQNWDIIRDDVSYSYSTPFNIAYTPTTIILDQNGDIVKKIVGSEQGSYVNIKAEIDSLL